jgi:hypothetical protein
MKKIKTLGLIVLIGLLLPAALQARPISLPEAEQAARAWVARDNPQKNARLTPVDFTLDRVTPLTRQEAVVGYVASLSPQGFIIIPAASELSPVQYISYDSPYDTVQSHPFLQTIRERLYGALLKLGYLTPTDFLLSQETAALDRQQVNRSELAWETLTGDQSLSQNVSSALVAPLLTSKWNQYLPFSLYTPNQYPTGCSITALAQVMYYWKYPAGGQGYNQYFWAYEGRNLEADFSLSHYQWDKMIDDYSGGATLEQQQAVARLMADMGIALNANYTPDGTEAYLHMNDALVTFFKYSPYMSRINRNDFATTIDWFENIKAQLNARLPVPITLEPFKHALVVDGYRTDNYLSLLHVNLGWGGAHDGYYAPDAIYGDNFGDSALINIFPPGFQPTGPVVSGTVTGYDQLPVKCEKVEFWKESSPGVFSKAIETQTDSEGRYFGLLIPGTYKVYFNSGFANYHPDCMTSGRKFNDEWYKDQTNMITHPELSIDLAETIQVTSTSQHTINAVLERYCAYPQNVSYFKYASYHGFLWDHQYQGSDLDYHTYCDSFQIQRSTYLDFRDAVEVYRGMPFPYYNNLSGTPPGSYYYRIRSHDDACGVSSWFYSILVEITSQGSNIYLPLIIRN